MNETGSTLSSPFTLPFNPVPQTTDSIDAWAGVLNLAYTSSETTPTPGIDMSLAAGSGDDDRLTSAGTIGGNSPNTTDRSFNSLGYINTGLALAPQIANLMMLRVGGSTAIPLDMQASQLAPRRSRLLLLRQGQYRQPQLDRHHRQTMDRLGDGLETRLADHDRRELQLPLRRVLPRRCDAIGDSTTHATSSTEASAIPSDRPTRIRLLHGADDGHRPAGRRPGLPTFARSSSRACSSGIRRNSTTSTFWDDLAAEPIVSNDDALHALILMQDGRDPSADFEGRMAIARTRKAGSREPPPP